MKRISLIRWLAWLFTGLFYGQFVLYAVGIWFVWALGQSLNPVGREPSVHVRVQVGGRSLLATPTEKAFIARQPTDPARPIVATLRQVDSTIRANPNAEIVYTKDGYAITPFFVGNFLTTTLPVGGRITEFGLGVPNSRAYKPKRPNPWAYRLQVIPDVALREKSTQDDELTINVATWQEWRELPISLRVTFLFWLLLPTFLVVLAYQFMRLTRSLARNDMFSQWQIKRIRSIGYVCLLYPVFDAAKQWYSLHIARQYMSQFTDPATNHISIFTRSINQAITIGWSWLLMGFCILALAEVFRYGMALKQEHELTI